MERSESGIGGASFEASNHLDGNVGGAGHLLLSESCLFAEITQA